MFLMAAKLFLPRISLPPLTNSVHKRTITAPSSLKRNFPFRRGLRTNTNMEMPKSSGASAEAIGGLDEEYELPPEYYDDEEYELPPECFDDEEFRGGVRTNTNMGMPKSTEASTEAIGGVDEEYELPPEYYDDEWQARQREKTEELHRRRQEEDEEENRKVAEYREIGSRLMGYPQEEVIKARKLVSSFIRSAEEIEEEIEKAADRGELNELVLMVIWNRLDLARRDDEKDAIRSLDLLYRRVETEILKREATPSMRLLNDLLNLYDGFDNEEWLKQCRKCMVDTFPREDPFSVLVPTGMDINTQQSRIGLPAKDDDVLLRVDFIREVDALIQEVRSEQSKAQLPEGFDPESVAARLKQQEKQRTLHQIEALLDLALTLKW